MFYYYLLLLQASTKPSINPSAQFKTREDNKVFLNSDMLMPAHHAGRRAYPYLR